MIVIFTSIDDKHVERVCKWFGTNVKFEVIFWENFFVDYYFELHNEDSLIIQNKESKVEIDLYKDVNLFWYKRFNLMWGSKSYDTLDPDLETFFSKEIENLTYYIHKFIYNHKKTINSPFKGVDNKLLQRYFAQQSGLRVPECFISNCSDSINRFYKTNHKNSLITKALGTLPIKKKDGNIFVGYTTEINDEDLAGQHEMTFPTLLQEKIEKEFEIRIFFLCEKLFPLGILSQYSKESEIDFRRSNYSKDMPMIGIKLEIDLEKKIKNLISYLKLDSGSIDIIKAKNSEYTFLEVNKYGQFEMIQTGGHVNINKETAKLILQEYEKSK